MSEAQWLVDVCSDGVLLLPDPATSSAAAPPTGAEVSDAEPMAPMLPKLLHRADGTIRGLLIAPLGSTGERARTAELSPHAPGVSDVADILVRAGDLEELTRPLLDVLHEVSGLASTYLTVIDEDIDQQEVRFARNERPEEFQIPEGIQVPWADTLCKRALDEGRPATSDVPSVWDDSKPAADLGIVTYVSVPVRLSDGRVWGTLCGADDHALPHADELLPTLGMFARLIGSEVERSAAMAHERERAERAQHAADTDDLTGCSSRRVIEPWLNSAASSLPSGHVLGIVYVDVDGFKTINDSYGHAAGDAVLAELGHRLRGISRPDDLVARLGGDEFLVAATLASGQVEHLAQRVGLAAAFTLTHEGKAIVVASSVGSATSADGGQPAAILVRADTAMYAEKARHHSAGGPSDQ